MQLALRFGSPGVKMEAGKSRAMQSKACLISGPSKGVNGRGGFFCLPFLVSRFFFWPARVVTAAMIPHRAPVLCIPLPLHAVFGHTLPLQHFFSVFLSFSSSHTLLLSLTYTIKQPNACTR